jgi:hypothetical protein
MRKLAAAFPGSFGDEERVTSVAALWRELLDQHPSVTKAAFVAGVYEIAWKHQSDYLPAPAAALDFFRLAQQKIERETQKALPPPAPVTQSAWDKKSGPERVAFFERHVAIGKLRARAGKTDLNVPFEADESEIAEVVAQMRRRGFLGKTLERIGAREEAPLADIGAEMTGRWPGAKGVNHDDR